MGSVRYRLTRPLGRWICKQHHLAATQHPLYTHTHPYTHTRNRLLIFSVEEKQASVSHLASKPIEARLLPCLNISPPVTSITVRVYVRPHDSERVCICTVRSVNTQLVDSFSLDCASGFVFNLPSRVCVCMFYKVLTSELVTSSLWPGHGHDEATIILKKVHNNIVLC